MTQIPEVRKNIYTFVVTSNSTYPLQLGESSGIFFVMRKLLKPHWLQCLL